MVPGVNELNETQEEAEGVVGAKAPAEQADTVVGLDYDSQRRIRIIDELIEENNPRIEQLADPRNWSSMKDDRACEESAD